MMNYIAMAIPVFFLLIGVEWLVALVLERKVYRFNDAINDLSCGILQQVLGVFTKAIVFGVYALCWERIRLLELDAGSWVTWVLCFLGVDFFYYWFHRVSHEVNLPWGAHIVHHSSEEYNLAVALRQGALQPLFSWVFYLPLAWLGFPPVVFLACSSFNTLYQFWIHTRIIGKMGPFEWVFNTPSHHRVHHGCDEKYLDRNYAGTLIIWDRLFGSFQAEEEEPTYGITKPLASWNPLWANLHYYADLRELAKRAPTWREKFMVWWKPPAWKPDWAPSGPGEARGRTPLSHGDQGKYDARAPGGFHFYVAVHYLGAIALTVHLLFAGEALSFVLRGSVACMVAWTVLNLGVLFERRRWVLASELARPFFLALLTILLVEEKGESAILLAAGLGFAVAAISTAWILRRRARFDRKRGDADQSASATPQ